MFRYHLKFALRLLMSNKTFTFVNVAGLALGTLCCLYILLYVQDQYSYDKHHQDAENIYRVNSHIKISGESFKNSMASPPIGRALKNDFSEVVQFTRVIPTINVNQHLITFGEKVFYEKKVLYVDSTFFDVFDWRFDHGRREQALKRPFTIVISKEVSEKLFGQDNPIGKVVTIDNAYGKNEYEVSGVVDASLGKSHIQANIFITMNGGGIGEFVLSSDAWAGNNFAATYIKLNKGVPSADFEKRLPAFLNKYGQQQLSAISMEKTLKLQPVTTIHTSTDHLNELGKTANPTFLKILLLVAILIQLIACINFMNLSTARASKRAREVGVRKVIGAEKKQLVQQFMTESFLWTLIGVGVAIPLLLLALPQINQLAGADVSSDFLTKPSIWYMLGALVVSTGVISGSYPAFYLSAFHVIRVIKGNLTNHISDAGIRRSLVVFQFVLSIAMISSIVIFQSQLKYLNNKDLGYDREQKLIFTFHTSEAIQRIDPFINDVRKVPGVSVVSRANNYPSQFFFNDINLYLEGGSPSRTVATQFLMADEHFSKALNIEIVGGRPLRRNDSGQVLINETAARQLGVDLSKAEGTLLLSPPNAPGAIFTLAGVMKDFNNNSLREPVKPFMVNYVSNDPVLSKLIVSTNSDEYKNLLKDMKGVWDRHFKGIPFEFAFLDEEVQKQYESEITMSNIINSFTVMAIIISCLGLFGLAAFSAEQRTKEIGIRKVLGASESRIVFLLSKDFMKLVMVALLIAVPIAWWVMNKWLEAFAFRITITWWMFALAGIMAVLITLLTISFQAIKAALSNPVNSLRSE
jgi:putative ABC transport system permease protein